MCLCDHDKKARTITDRCYARKQNLKVRKCVNKICLSIHMHPQLLYCILYRLANSILLLCYSSFSLMYQPLYASVLTIHCTLYSPYKLNPWLLPDVSTTLFIRLWAHTWLGLSEALPTVPKPGMDLCIEVNHGKNPSFVSVMPSSLFLTLFFSDPCACAWVVFDSPLIHIQVCIPLGCVL